MSNNSKQSQSGNVLFLILIAAALFAALSYVIVNSTRSGSGSIDKENSKLAAAEILNYVTAVQSAVQIITQRKQCSLDKLSFDNPFDSGAHTNPNAPLTHECDVFRPEGGSVPFKTAKPEWIASSDPNLLNFFFTSSDAITGVGTTCATPDCAELSMNIWGLQKPLCEALNTMMGEGSLNNSIPTDTLAGCTYGGTFDCAGDGNVTIVFAAPSLARKLSACYYDTNYGYTFNTVLIAR